MLNYILPILIGAIIGYVTNAIAIKMLFRPYTEKRLFNIKIPFTPGVIPRQRDKMAKGIANLVANQLFTEDAIKMHLYNEELQNKLKDKIDQTLLKLINKENQEKKEIKQENQENIKKIINIIVKSSLKSALFYDNIENITNKLIINIKKIKINTFLDKNLIDINNILYIIDSHILNDLNLDKIKNSFIKELENNIDKQLKLNEIVKDENIDILIKILDKNWLYLINLLIASLKKKEVKDTVVVQATYLLNNILKRLDSLQQVFLILGNYDKKISNNMPAIIDDLLNTIDKLLTEKDTKYTIIKSLDDFLKSNLNKTILELQKKYNFNIVNIFKSLLDFIIKYIKSDNFKRLIKFRLIKLKRENKNIDIKVIIEDILKLNSKELSKKIKDFLIIKLNKEEVINYISVNINNFLLNNNNSMNLSFLFEYRYKEEINNIILKILNSYIDEQIINILSDLNIYELVENKINSLDIKGVENLLLIIIESQLKWINVFGAFLGGLMGFLQIIINIIGK